jgi:hypothetical protein
MGKKSDDSDYRLTIAAFYDSLKNYDGTVIRKAMYQWAQNEKWFPKINELKNMCGNIDDRRYTQHQYTPYAQTVMNSEPDELQYHEHVFEGEAARWKPQAEEKLRRAGLWWRPHAEMPGFREFCAALNAMLSNKTGVKKLPQSHANGGSANLNNENWRNMIQNPLKKGGGE